MKALIIVGSLKAESDQSNTQALAELAQEKLLARGFSDVELVYLRDLRFQPGTDRVGDQGADDLTAVMAQTLDSDCVILATPIWWGVHSSLIQAYLERMCWFDNQAIKTSQSVMYGKTLGVIISGSDDGFQQITGLLMNFATNLGFTVPPDAVVPCTAQNQEKIHQDERTQQHLEIFSRNLHAWTELLTKSGLGSRVQNQAETRPPYV